jgi:hypothetical protein
MRLHHLWFIFTRTIAPPRKFMKTPLSHTHAAEGKAIVEFKIIMSWECHLCRKLVA